MGCSSSVPIPTRTGHNSGTFDAPQGIRSIDSFKTGEASSETQVVRARDDNRNDASITGDSDVSVKLLVELLSADDRARAIIASASIDNVNELIVYSQSTSSSTDVRLLSFRKLREITAVAANRSKVLSVERFSSFINNIVVMINGGINLSNSVSYCSDRELLLLSLEILANLIGSVESPAVTKKMETDIEIQGLLQIICSEETGPLRQLTAFLRTFHMIYASTNGSDTINNSNGVDAFSDNPTIDNKYDMYSVVLKLLWYVSRDVSAQAKLGFESLGLLTLLIESAKCIVDPKEEYANTSFHTCRVLIFKILRNLSLHTDNKIRMGGDPETGFVSYLIDLIKNDNTEAFPLALQMLWCLGKDKTLRKHLLSEDLVLSDMLYGIAADKNETQFRKDTLKLLFQKKKDMKYPV